MSLRTWAAERLLGWASSLVPPAPAEQDQASAAEHIPLPLSESWATDNLGTPPLGAGGPMYPGDGGYWQNVGYGPSIPDDQRRNALRWSRVLAANHYAGQVFGLMLDHVLGDVFQVNLRARDRSDVERVEQVNALLHQWMRHRKLGRRAWARLYTRRNIDGELIRLIRPGDPEPRITYIDPLDVREYAVDELHGIAQIVVPRSAIDYGSDNLADVTLPVVSSPDELDLLGPDGVVLHDARSDGIHPCGTGLLYSMIRILNLDEQYWLANLRRAIAAGSVYMGVTVKRPATGPDANKDTRQLLDEARALLGDTLPPPGSALYSTDAIDINLNAPQLGMYESKAGAGANVKLIGAAAGIPPTWLGLADDANRATAAEMGSPAFKRMKREQGDWREDVVAFISVPLEMLRRRGLVVVPSDAYDVDVTLEELGHRESEAALSAVERATVTLITQVEQGWLTSRTAQAVALEMLQRMTDIELDAEAEGQPPERDHDEDLQERVTAAVRRVRESM